MDKDIRYSGYSAVPSDYDSPDGDLALSLNLINEDGALRPIFPAKPILSLASGENVIYIHHTSAIYHYITRSASGAINWISKSAPNIKTELPLLASDKPLRVCAVGNTLIFSTTEGLLYFLWRDNAYIRLGYRPPFTSIAFGCRKVGTLSDSVSAEFPDCPVHTLTRLTTPGDRAVHYAPTEEDNAFQNILSNAVYGMLLSSLAENVTSQGYFYQPFFIRYAYRLFDGSYYWHSAPVLMLPSVTVPIVRINSATASGTTLKITHTLDVNYFSLVYRIFKGIDQLTNWKDIISGIDIFISAPIYTYDQSGKVNGICRMRDLLLFGLYDGYTPELRPGANGSGTGTRPPSRGDSDTDKYFVGHYADSDGIFKDHTLIPSEQSGTVWEIPHNDAFHDKVRSAQSGNFYKIASLDLDEIVPGNSMEPLSIDLTDLSNLVTRPTLSDDYQSHFGIAPTCLYPYNSRLNAANINLIQAPPLPFRSVVDFDNSKSAARVQIKVWSRHDGVRCYTIDNFNSALASADNPSFASISGTFPRYIYYPDASAYKMQLTCGSFKRTIKLSPHDFLNGAYWYGGLAADCTPLDNQTEDSDVTATSVRLSSKLYTSEAGNPFIFQPTNINTVGTGEIIAISSAAKALSQGQFGQFPLYTFTSEGILAMEVNTGGTYATKQPITRDVCINPDSITQIDSSVLFASDRGIMIISGSQTQCISEAINSDTPFSLSSLQGIEKLHTMLGHTDSSCIAIAPFSRFLADCRMIYNYTDQRIILFSPSYSYAYVYSLKSNQWGMIHSKFTMAVNSYPESLAMNSDSQLIDLAQTNAGSIGALAVSRPLKLGASDIHKTINSIIQRGHFRKGNVKAVLYASRDLYSWHLVWSSTDHFLRRFSGTPYKYFRLAILCNFAPDESISGCSVRFVPRLTNHPR